MRRVGQPDLGALAAVGAYIPLSLHASQIKGRPIGLPLRTPNDHVFK